MNDMVKETFESISEIIWKCINCEDVNMRIRYGVCVMKLLKELKQSTYKIYNNSEIIIDKLVTSASTLQQQNDWINCLQTAIGDNYDIMHAALTAKEVLENYKMKKKREQK